MAKKKTIKKSKKKTKKSAKPNPSPASDEIIIHPTPDKEEVKTFQDKIDEAIAKGEDQGGAEQSGAGGPRPGAGRPPGSTNKQRVLDKIGDETNPLFVPIVKIPFELWADAVKVPELKLSQVEADQLSLPVTQLVNYYLPIINENPVLAMWFGVASVAAAVMMPRFAKLAAIRSRRAQVNVKDAKPPATDAGRGGFFGQDPPPPPADPDVTETGPNDFPKIA